MSKAPNQEMASKGDWSTIKRHLQQLLGQKVVSNWFSEVSIASASGGVATLLVTSKFNGEYIQANFAEEIVASCRHAGLKVYGTDFRVTSRNRTQASRQSRPSGQNQASPTQLLKGLRLNKRYSFDSFVVGTENGHAYDAARRIGQGNLFGVGSLYIYGSVGLGKTHLLNAICWMRKSSSPDLTVKLLSGDLFMDRYVRAVTGKRLLEFRELVRSVDVLAIDDIQFFEGRRGTTEEFEMTFSALSNEQKTVVLTGQKPVVSMNGLNVRLRSRLQQGLTVGLKPPGLDLRLRILQRKIEDWRHEYPDLEISPEVLEYVAKTFTGDVRLLEGALQRLLATAGFLRSKKITPDLVEHVLTDLAPSAMAEPNIDDIVKAVSEHFGVSAKDLKGQTRIRNIARARQIAIYLAKNLTTKSLPHIGSTFSRDRTTILYSVKRVRKLQKTDQAAARDLRLLESKLRYPTGA